MTAQFKNITRIEINYLEEKSELVMCIVVDKEQEAWQKYVQHLSKTEFQQLNNQRTDNAKNSFCLGKISAKTSISSLLQIPLNEITIDHGIFGFPVIQPNFKGTQVSIAHTDNSGIAVCFNEKYMVGIDIEEVNATNNEAICSSLSKEEIRMKSSVNLSETMYYHIMWSAREALSKTLKTGFLISLEFFEIKSVSNISDYYKIEFKNFSLFTGFVFQLNEFVIALVVPARLAINTDFIQEIKRQY